MLRRTWWTQASLDRLSWMTGRLEASPARSRLESLVERDPLAASGRPRSA